MARWSRSPRRGLLLILLCLMLILPLFANSDSLIVSEDVLKTKDPVVLVTKARNLVTVDPGESIRYGEQAARLLSAATDQKLELELHAVLAVAYAQTGQSGLANERLKQALEMGPGLGDQAHAKALVAQASVAFVSGRIDEAHEAATQALEKIDPEQDQELRMEALNIDGMTSLYREDAERATARFFEMQKLASSLNLPEKTLTAEANLGAALIMMGELDIA